MDGTVEQNVDVTSDTLKHLKRHAADRLLVLCLQAGKDLVSLRHPRSKEVKRSAATLELHWEELKKSMATRGKALEDNRDFLEFLQKVEEVEAWIRHKVGANGWRDGWCVYSLFTVCNLCL